MLNLSEFCYANTQENMVSFKYCDKKNHPIIFINYSIVTHCPYITILEKY